MPELPDLQIFSKNLKNKLADKKIISFEIYNKTKFDMDIEKIEKILIDTEIIDVIRDGKELSFKLKNDNVFNIHLMLNGTLDICDKDNVSKINSKIMSIAFIDNQVLVVSDYQGLCKVAFNPITSSVPDALSCTFEYLIGVAKINARKNVKAFIIDQNVIKGIGNAYADEILWKANISPESKTGKIPEDRLKDLFDAIYSVLEEAIESIGKIAPDIISGEERSFLKVHNSKKENTDDGYKILTKKIASKNTYYTEKQQLFI